MQKKLAAFSFALTLSVSLPAFAQSESDIASQIRALKWVDGPTTVTTVGDASIVVPQNYSFLDAVETRKFNLLLQNPPGQEINNTIVPDDFKWQAYLSFDPVGYVKDDEQLDADALLQSFKDGTEASNVERKKNGWPALHVTGWKYPPHYDNRTNRLVWAMEAQSEGGEKVINYNERLLGRKGVTSATLVTAPEDLDAAVKDFEYVLAGYKFSPGSTYAEFKPGDHVAELGLAALILGGGAAAVAKSGAAKGFLKVLFFAGAAGFLAVIGFIRKMFGGSSKQ